MAHPTMTHEEESLPIHPAVFFMALVIAIAVILVGVGWLSCELLLPPRPFTY
jgi:hypothetical protein